VRVTQQEVPSRRYPALHIQQEVPSTAHTAGGTQHCTYSREEVPTNGPGSREEVPTNGPGSRDEAGLYPPGYPRSMYSPVYSLS